ncbi:MAG: HNH endonuclease, partial [Streptosporangiaceae bacterium]
MNTVPPPASATQALGMLESAMGYLSAADATQLAAETQIRNAVILRDRHCQWAGRCGQPAAACEVHHVRHKENGGKTSARDCVLLCTFHHQVAIHRWGWT